MGKLTAVDINPFFGSIQLVRLEKKPGDRFKESIETVLVPVLMAYLERPVDVIIVPRLSYVTDKEDERIDIAAAIHRLLKQADNAEEA